MILTRAFQAFVSSEHFRCVFCRKGDPQSKGKVESVVKYVKYGFLRGRDFTNIDMLNESTIRCVLFKGTNKVYIIDSKTIGGPILSQYNEATKWLKQRLAIEYIKDGFNPLAPIRKKDDSEYERYIEAKALYDAEFLKPLKERNQKLEQPMYQQYILSDFTPEVLVRQHKANPMGLIVFFDELIGFIYSFNKYRSGADEQMWTQLFAGGGVTVNRVGADPVKINDTCIGVFGGIQPEILSTFARGKIQSGFVARWLFAFPEKVPYPKFNDVDIDERIACYWERIVNRILELPFDSTPLIVKLCPEAKRLYKEWFDKLSEQKNNGGSSFAGLATKMDRYCGRFSLALEVMKYGCGESDLLEISEDSMRGAIALCYYFIACGLKAHKKFVNSPVDELPGMQKTIYDELPQSFETGRALEVALRYGMPERTFKRWLSTSLFKKVEHGYYEKRFR